MASATHLPYQLRATRALVKFIADHNGEVDADLANCLGALEHDDVSGAVRCAKNVKVVGMGSITDWFPPVVFPHETSEYVWAELEALAHNWWRLIALSLDKESET
jgi:hypothetical protein